MFIIVLILSKEEIGVHIKDLALLLTQPLRYPFFMLKVRFLGLGLGVFSGCIRLAFLTGEMQGLEIE